MTALHDVRQPYVDRGEVPGAVGLVAGPDGTEVAVVGSMDAEGTAPKA